MSVDVPSLCFSLFVAIGCCRSGDSLSGLIKRGVVSLVASELSLVQSVSELSLVQSASELSLVQSVSRSVSGTYRIVSSERL